MGLIFVLPGCRSRFGHRPDYAQTRQPACAGVGLLWPVSASPWRNPDSAAGDWTRLRGFLGGLLVTAFASVFDWVAFAR
jgi:hypothetical protein